MYIADLRGRRAAYDYRYYTAKKTRLFAGVSSLRKLIPGWFAKVVVMYERSTEQIRELPDSLYRADSGRILATLIRLLGDFDLAKEAMHEAFAAVDFDGTI
jgi:hypothetical protein